MIFTLPFSKSMAEISILVAFIFWILKRISDDRQGMSLADRFKPTKTGINLLIYIFVICGIISTVVSSAPLLSLKGLFSKLLKGIVLFFITTEVINSRKKLYLILTAMVLSMLFMSADGIYQIVTGWDFLRHYGQDGRMTASFSCSNGFGGWIVIMSPLLLGIMFTGRNQRPKMIIKFIILVLTCSLIFCLLRTGSSGSLIGAFFAIIFFMMFKRDKTFLTSAIIILALLASIVSFFMYLSPDLPGLLKAANKSGPIFSIKDIMVQVMLKIDVVRTNLWREAILIIRDFPLFGCGLNAYSVVAPAYKSGLSEAGIYPHNSYLQMAAEMGLIGLASFILIIIGLFRTSLTNMKKIKDNFFASVLLGLLAGLSGFFAHSFFDVNFYAFQLVNVMWFIMGLIIAVQEVALHE